MGPPVEGLKRRVFGSSSSVDQPLKLIMEGKYPPMPLIIGNTLEETMPWADTAGRVTDDASCAAAIDKVFATASRERILAQYPVKS